MLSKLVLSLRLALICVLLAACAPSSPSTQPAPTAEAQATTATAPTATTTSTPTTAASATQTSTPTSTPTATPELGWLDLTYPYRLSNRLGGEQMTLTNSSFMNDLQLWLMPTNTLPSLQNPQFWSLLPTAEGYYQLAVPVEAGTALLTYSGAGAQARPALRTAQPGLDEPALNWRLVFDGAGHYRLFNQGLGEELALGVSTQGDFPELVFLAAESGEAALWQFSQVILPVMLNPCKLPDVAQRGDVGLGYPRVADRLPTTGVIRAAMIFVDFPDAPASRQPEDLLPLFQPGMADFFRAMSYGQVEMEITPYPTWLRMGRASYEYGAGDGFTFDEHHNLIGEAVRLADPQVDFSPYQAIYVITNPDASAIPNGPAFTGNPFLSFNLDGATIHNAVSSGHDLLYWYSPLWLSHEIGHLFGLADLYNYGYDPNANDVHRFVGGWGLMGDIGGPGSELMAYERWLLGWLDDEAFLCQQSAEATVTLTTVALPGGVKAVMVPTGPTSGVVVESRRALGYDQRIPEGGALVYSIDTSVLSGYGPLQIHSLLAEDPYFVQAPLQPGESITIGAVTITVLAAGENGDTVRVQVNK